MTHKNHFETMTSTTQTRTWNSTFGALYTDRNPQTMDEMDALYRRNYGLTRSELNQEFLGDMDRTFRILEVGTNIGIQLQLLQNMGFQKLHGMDVQAGALEKAGLLGQNIEWTLGDASGIPFNDNLFDMVFTAGVLIHISPQNLSSAIGEIHRCTKRYIWGYEYFSEKQIPIPYRGNDNLMWKANFPKLYLEQFPDLRLVKERKIPYLGSRNQDVMFLLEKTDKTD